MPKTTRWGERSFEFRLEMACERRVLGAFNQNRLKDGFKKNTVHADAYDFHHLSAVVIQNNKTGYFLK